MYFATSSANMLEIPRNNENSVLTICANARRTHFCVVTNADILIWRARVSAELSYSNRL